MTRQPGHLNGSNNKNYQGSIENWRTGSTCVGFSTIRFINFILGYSCIIHFLTSSIAEARDCLCQFRDEGPEKTRNKKMEYSPTLYVEAILPSCLLLPCF